MNVNQSNFTLSLIVDGSSWYISFTDFESLNPKSLSYVWLRSSFLLNLLFPIFQKLVYFSTIGISYGFLRTAGNKPFKSLICLSERSGGRLSIKFFWSSKSKVDESSWYFSIYFKLLFCKSSSFVKSSYLSNTITLFNDCILNSFLSTLVVLNLMNARMSLKLRKILFMSSSLASCARALK
jgi:hypothetical protein